METRISWSPLRGSQILFLTCPADYCLYDGGRGFGKTDSLLIDYAMDINCGWGNRWQGLLLRKTYADLKDVIEKSKRIFPLLFPNARYIDKPQYKWVFPKGECLKFGYLDIEEDYQQYHGHEYQWIGIEEITLWDDDKWLDQLITTLRSPVEGIPTRLRATTNPFGPGRNWVKKRFIDNCRFGKVHHQTQTIRANGKEIVTDITTACVFGNLLENETMIPTYMPKLMAINDPNQRKAHLLGSWDVISGGIIDDLWSESIHMIPGFEIPKTWRIDRSYDHGEGHPFSIGWWAEADGIKEVEVRGEKIKYPKGTLFRIDEFYGAEEGNDKEGLRMTITEIANIIKQKEGKEPEVVVPTSPYLNGRYIYPGPAESAMWQPKNRDDVARKFAKAFGNGQCPFKPVAKKPGSRIAGKDLLRDRLQASLKELDKPRIYFFDNCLDTKRILPTIKRDPKNLEDAMKCAGDDLWDEILYKLLGIRADGVSMGEVSS